MSVVVVVTAFPVPEHRAEAIVAFEAAIARVRDEPVVELFALHEGPDRLLSLYNAADVSVPAAVSVFPGENYQAPRSWTERAYHQLVYFNEAGKGGHFAAWEQPQLFSKEVRAGFRTLR
jgi:pimeloyl-ACP methyl ester carboxylesterase